MGTPPHRSKAVTLVTQDVDIITARRTGRDLATRAGCTGSELTEVAAAISEIARNMLSYAGGGQVEVHLVERSGCRGVEVVATDRGPGIADLERALEDGYTTGSGLGLGLPGARRLMDEFEITTVAGQGTTVVMRKWSAPSHRPQPFDHHHRGVA